MEPSTTAQNVRPATNAPQAPPTDGTEVTVTNDSESHDTTQLHGDQVTYDATDTTTTRTAGTWPASADEHVRGLISEAQAEREARENKRANHRNLNRFLTLLGAILIGFVVTYALQHNMIPDGKSLAPYAFVITVLMDAMFVLYALIRHY